MSLLLHRSTVAAGICLAMMLISCGGAQNEKPVVIPDVPEIFEGDERLVVGELFKLWSRKGQTASVDQAAARVGVEVSDSLRTNLLKKFNSKLMMHDLLARYQPYTFILTNEEKLIAEYIINFERINSAFPPLDSVASALHLTSERIADRLRFLASLEMFFDLGSSDEYNALGFSYGNKMRDFTYDLGIRQHEFVIDGGLPLNVGCAKEAFYVVATSYPKAGVVYRTYDPTTLEQITVTFDKNQIISVAPQTAVILEGGTCGTNNLFVNAEVAHEYAARMPQLQGKMVPVYDLRDRFEETKRQAEEDD